MLNSIRIKGRLAIEDIRRKLHRSKSRAEIDKHPGHSAPKGGEDIQEEKMSYAQKYDEVTSTEIADILKGKSTPIVPIDPRKDVPKKDVPNSQSPANRDNGANDDGKPVT